MCGITGFLEPSGARQSEDLRAIAAAMAQTLHHRGPDDRDTWVDPAVGVAMGHRRLSIIDVSSSGRQPMVATSRNIVLTFNGEIYNFRELRKDLRNVGVRFRGTSDTEVLVEAIDHWGLERTLPRLNGMFAFAVWDRVRRRMSLVRDRMGEKPLYYGRAGSAFVFGSELKALRAHPSFSPEISARALAVYLRYGYVPTPHAIYAGINKLPPGSVIELEWPSLAARGPRRYWSLPLPGEEVDKIAPQEAVERLDRLLADSVRMRMIADVPIGAFLSGGIDSSTIVAIMQAHANARVKTFSIGFHEQGYDEAPFARAVADHLGSDHSEVYVSAAEAMADVPRLPSVYDEPFADSSQIPTLIVSRLARQEVTVALSGDGGDELFGGYDRYTSHSHSWSKVSAVPRPARKGLARLSRALATCASGSSERPSPAHPFSGLSRGARLMKLASVLELEDQAAMYEHLVAHWHRSEDLVLGKADAIGSCQQLSPVPSVRFPELMMSKDQRRYLPDDILTKVDRATMAVSLEARIPLLDHRVVEFACRLPLEMKIRNGKGKWALREVLRRYVPDDLVDRPKRGFAVPVGDWIRGPLRQWAEELLSTRRLDDEGFLDPAPVRASWDEHLNGRLDHSAALWSVLMLQAWLDETRRGAAAVVRASDGAP